MAILLPIDPLLERYCNVEDVNSWLEQTREVFTACKTENIRIMFHGNNLINHALKVALLHTVCENVLIARQCKEKYITRQLLDCLTCLILVMRESICL